MGRHARRKVVTMAGKVSLAALGAAGIGVAAVAALGLAPGAKPTPGPAGGAGSSAAVPGPAGGSFSTPDAAAAVHPVSLSIPAIKVDTTLQLLGLDSAGALNPPTNLTQAGWYTGSVVPGDPGPSIIAGHVDSYAGPAVFFELRYLTAGDTITVKLSDGTSVEFAVTDVERYPKDDFPTQSVYGARPDPELRMITCGGAFAAGHYLDDVVVYARLANTPV
jgi:sortase (surface protein transpeptidase)